MSLPGRGRAIPFDGMHRRFSRVRRPHLKALPAKPHHAATDVDREDDPAPGTRSRRWKKRLTWRPRLDDPIKNTAPCSRKSGKIDYFKPRRLSAFFTDDQGSLVGSLRANAPATK